MRLISRFAIRNDGPTLTNIVIAPSETGAADTQPSLPDQPITWHPNRRCAAFSGPSSCATARYPLVPWRASSSTPHCVPPQKNSTWNSVQRSRLRSHSQPSCPEEHFFRCAIPVVAWCISAARFLPCSVFFKRSVFLISQWKNLEEIYSRGVMLKISKFMQRSMSRCTQSGISLQIIRQQ